MTAQSNRYAVRDKITLETGEVTTLWVLANAKRLKVETTQHASRHAKAGSVTWYSAALIATGEQWPISKVTYERLKLRIAGKRITKSGVNADRLVIQFSREELEYLQECCLTEFGKASSLASTVTGKITKQLNKVTTK